MVPALIILALWVVLLAPGVVRWIRNHQPTTSIASFHRQLRLLEQSGPKIVEPAYRLGGHDAQVMEREPAPPPTRVPRLVLLPSGPTDKESTMRYDDRHAEPSQAGYDRADRWEADPWAQDDPGYEEATRSYRTVRAPRLAEYDDYDEYEEADNVGALSPERAKVRRTRIIAGLGAAIAGSFILGLLPGMTVMWALTFIAVAAMVAYLGLMFYASSAGMYGQDMQYSATPVARVVVPAFTDYDSAYDADDGWDTGRIAAAR